MTKKKIVFLIILLFITIDIFAQYNRIVSLAPSVTESLYELGMDEQVIANTTFCPEGKTLPV